MRRTSNNSGGDGDGVQRPPASATNTTDPSQVVGALPRFLAFLRAGDPKEAWLSVSAPALVASAPVAALAVLLHAPPALAVAAVSLAVAAVVSELWKILEGFQG